MPDQSVQNSQIVLYSVASSFVFWGIVIYFIFRYFRRRRGGQAPQIAEKVNISLRTQTPEPNQSRRTVKKIIGWVAFSAIVGLLLASHTIYLSARSGTSDGRKAVCGAASTDNRSTDLQEIALHSDYWNYQPVSVSGKLSYASGRETFYLRDGIFNLPLDISDCQNLGVFKGDETLVAIKGTVAKNGGEPLLVVTDLREMVPGWVKVMFNGGIWGGIALLAAFFGGLTLLFMRFLVAIRLMKPKPAPSAEELEERKAKKAGGALSLGIVALISWPINPILGITLQIVAVITGWDGLKSQKRKVAIAGIILCAVGFVAMTIASIGFGWFEKPIIDFYGEGSTLIIKPTGKETLELEPYINNEMHFSIHQPKGWTLDESEGGSIGFNGPKIDTVDGEPVYAQMGIITFPAQGLSAKDLKDFAEGFKEGVAEDAKDFTAVEEGSHLLAGGRLEAYFLEAKNKPKDVDQQGIFVFVAKNDVVYIIGAGMPVSDWNTYGQVIKDSIRTFEVWDATFAACLKSKGAVLYSVLHCPYCKTQIERFRDGIERLPYIECNAFDNFKVGEVFDASNFSELNVCSNKGIDRFPTWEFADGSRLVGEQTLKALSEKTGCPVPK